MKTVANKNKLLWFFGFVALIALISSFCFAGGFGSVKATEASGEKDFYIYGASVRARSEETLNEAAVKFHVLISDNFYTTHKINTDDQDVTVEVKLMAKDLIEEGKTVFTTSRTEKVITKEVNVIWKNSDLAKGYKEGVVYVYGISEQYWDKDLAIIAVARSKTGDTVLVTEQVTGSLSYVAYQAHLSDPDGSEDFVSYYNTKKYTVVWKNHDGSVLETDNDVAYFATPTYDGEQPKKESTDGNTYKWTGWDKEVEPARKNITYTAVFEKIIFAADYATVTRTHTSGGNSSTVDLSKMNDSNHTIKITDNLSFEGTDKYTEVKLNLPDGVKDAKYATVTFTLKYKDEAFDPLARVGIKMTGNNGMFLSVWGPSQTENCLHVCVFGRDKQNDMFDGWDSANNGRVEDVRTALSGNGMQIRMVRASDKIRMFVYLNNAWVELVNYKGVATCEESAETDIRLLILKHEWEFSNIEYTALEHVEAKPASTSETGNLEHYKVGDMYFNTDGTLTTQDAITLPVLTTVDATFRVTGYKDGVESALTGDVRFVNAENGKNYVLSLRNGVATETVEALTYQVTCGDYFETVDITTAKTDYTIVLQYKYAENTSDSKTGNSSIDFSAMNNSNHTIKMSDTWGNTTANYTEAQLNLPDEVKNAKNVSVTFTLKYLGSGFNNLSRFGVKMAGECGIHAFVTDGNLNADTIKHGVNEFDGNNVQGYLATDFEKALTGSTGLQVRVVRNGANIYMLVKLNGGWVRFTPLATCNESDVTDIRLLILAHEWEFSNIAYAATTQANVTHLGHNDTASVDLSKYDTDKTITMNDTKFDGTDKYTEAQLVLPDEVKNAKNVSVTFTLKHLGDFNAPHFVRFGVKMADGKGIFISMPDNSIQVCPIRADNAFDGYDDQNKQYSDSVKTALMGDGLQVKVTRTGTKITMSVYLNGTWETFTTNATCKESDETDIRLLIMMYEWEFSNIEYTVVNNG